MLRRRVRARTQPVPLRWNLLEIRIVQRVDCNNSILGVREASALTVQVPFHGAVAETSLASKEPARQIMINSGGSVAGEKCSGLDFLLGFAALKIRGKTLVGQSPPSMPHKNIIGHGQWRCGHGTG